MKTFLPLAIVPPDANIPPSCAVCRRRLRVWGKPVFSTCTCLQQGRAATVLWCVAGGAALVWWIFRRSRGA